VLPLQDAVPSGRAPLATIALLVINAVVFAAQLLLASAFPNIVLLSPFVHLGTMHFVATALFLWLFGDNVEARVGRGTFLVLYGASAATGMLTAIAVARGEAAIGAACAVSGVLGAYFVLLPKSPVLVLVPVPLDLAEVPAAFFLGVWWLLHAISFVAGPWAAPALLLPLLASFLFGAVVCLATRRQIVW
jgi:membrane associated rhomboid family serine protease